MNKTKNKTQDVLAWAALAIAAVSTYSAMTDVCRNGAARFAYMNQLMPFDYCRTLECVAPYARWALLVLTLVFTWFAIESAIQPTD